MLVVCLDCTSSSCFLGASRGPSGSISKDHTNLPLFQMTPKLSQASRRLVPLPAQQKRFVKPAEGGIKEEQEEEDESGWFRSSGVRFGKFRLAVRAGGRE